MSHEAAKASVLNKPNDPVLKNFGLEYSIDDERQQFHGSDGKRRNILNLIGVGANFEDNLLRPLNHFYDPLNGDALLPLVTKPSPTWALEDKGSILLLLWQRYSLADARDALYKALSLSDRAQRDENFGRAFETLGHVIHHIQDMAQPQHVRLDAHLKLSDADKPDWFFERGSRYESHTQKQGGNLPFTGYPLVTFDTAREFWTGQGRGIADFTNANFLSAGTNFDSGNSGTLPTPLRARDYPSPEWNGQIQTRTWAELLAEDGIVCDASSLPGGAGGDCGNECGPPPELPPACGLTGEMDFYGTNVVDRHNPANSGVNPRAATLSIFDQDLKPTGRRAFALNRFNFEATYPFLLPKAVAYSAGLLDFFFRGRLEVNDVSEVDGQLRIEVRNVSGAANSLKNGAFELYYDAPGGERNKIANVQNASVSELAPDGLMTIVAEKPALNDVDTSKETPLILVYKGVIGQEEGLVSAVLEMPLSGFIVRPSYLPADGIAGPRHIYKENGAWVLGQRTGLVAGVMDWKGWYVNGRPTKVLSWTGNEVYANGRLLSRAPVDVSGAALTRGADGRPWLVVIGYDYASNSDVVYRRPAKRSESTALHDPTNAPDGWQKAFSRPLEPKHYPPQISWSFNGSGTEAQTLRAVEKTVTEADSSGNSRDVKKVGLDRVKYINVEGAERIENLGNLSGYTKQATTRSINSRMGDVGCGREVFIGADMQVVVEERGEYIAGVDYVDTQELLAKVSKSTKQTRISVNAYEYKVEKTADGGCLERVTRTWTDTTDTKTGGEELQVNGQNMLRLETNDYREVASPV